ncbi:MAG: hypothetical protein J6Z22_07240 [Lachnospiraceae bacterium]|nr:hypothetical protein [Lachnospiraceae bacterium]
MKKFAGVLLVAGLLLSILSFREGIAGLKAPIDLYAYETNISEVGYFDMVTVDIFEVYGTFMTRTTTENGKQTNQDSYYMIPAHEGDEYRYIGIRVNEKEYDIFDKIYEDTYDYYEYGEESDLDYGVVKTGCLKKMSKKMQTFYYDTLREAEWYDTDEEMMAEALPYYIDPIPNPRSVVFMVLIGFVMTLLGGILLILSMRSEKAKTTRAVEQTYVVINGISYSKAQLARVNQLLQGQEKIFAVQELANITGMSLEEAGNVVEHWREYYY